MKVEGMGVTDLRGNKPAVIKLLTGDSLGPGWGEWNWKCSQAAVALTVEVLMEGKDEKHTKGNKVPDCPSWMGFLLSESHLFHHLRTSSLSAMPLVMH